MCPEILRRILSDSLLKTAMIKSFFRNRRNQKRSAQAVFSEVYSLKKWGDKGTQFFSGPGSLDEFSEPYINMLSGYLNSEFEANVTLVDLGCGDFRVGEKLVAKLPMLNYHGVDVVAEMIEQHNSLHANQRVQFSCLDLAQDPLPEGDVATIRQVLQHLSNQQIMQICQKFSQYQAVFITEHYPANLKQANADIVHGAKTRRKRNSAVVLDQAPFALNNLEEVLRVDHRRAGEALVTHLYRPTADSKQR